MSNPPIKSASKEFTTEPFYLIQTNGDRKRYVVSLKDKLSIRTLLAGFINEASKEVQVKIRDLDNPEKPVEYSGSLEKSDLHQLMTKHEDVIFHHGRHQLMFRIHETSEHVAFDEHGLIFIYTTKDYEDTLKNLNAPFKPNEKLIEEFDHWHYCLANGEEKLADLIKDLELEKE
jgi:hypothetical protein